MRRSNGLAWQARAYRVWEAGIEASHGVRTLGQRTLVPVMRAGVLRNLWVIEADGHARFLSPGKTRGCFHIIGHPGDLIIVVVDFLDAVRWHDKLGVACVVAFDVENMLHVIRRIWLDHSSRIIVLTESFDSRIQIAVQAVRGAYLRHDIAEWRRT